MKKAVWISGAIALAAAAAISIAGPRLIADEDNSDFGLRVQRDLNERAEKLLGVESLSRSALGPFTGADSTQAIRVARGLRVSLVSSAVHFSTDQIALWPNDEYPTHLFVCDEETSNPSVQRVDLSRPADANATTIVTGLSSCDPVRRTPWGSLTVAEEASDGGTYEIMNPLSITAPIAVTNRGTGTTSDPRVVKRKALGTLAFEGNPVLPDGTIIFGDELRPGAGNGNPGGGIYKFVPDVPYSGAGVITAPGASPFVSGKLFGLRVGSNGDFGQGTEIGQGVWTAIDPAPITDANGNIRLRLAQTALKFTGYYRPEDMDIDPIALSNDEVASAGPTPAACRTAVGVEEMGGVYGEVMGRDDEADAAGPRGAMLAVRRVVAGNPQFNFFDNIAFQPHTGNFALTEDGEVEVVNADGTTELRGNDILFCLDDGDDDDVQSDGCVRIASLRDTASEPTGIIFNGSGDTMYVSLQHRATGVGALLKITGFEVRRHRRERRDGEWFPWGWGKR